MRSEHNVSVRAAARDQGVLAMLRSLVPNRALTAAETLRIAELQANHLLQNFRIQTTAVPEEIVSELPRIRVLRETGLPVSGAAYWNGRHWIITINNDEPAARQRFSIMHEFKHVIDHTTKHKLYRDRPFQTAAEQAEHLADYFAACVLMPKMLVKRLWYRGPQSIADLSHELYVSPAAARYRLHQLGLLDDYSRCDRPSRSHPMQLHSRHLGYRRQPQITLARGGVR
jgi:Zn-dependent peptidase ImmA (M78 family)